MRAPVLFCCALAAAGCTGDFFEQPLVGERVCNEAWSGTWMLDEELVRELGEDFEEGTLEFQLQQPPGCGGSSLRVAATDAGDPEVYEERYAAELVRLGGRTFLNMRMQKQHEGELPAREWLYEIREIRNATDRTLEISVPDDERLLALIDDGMLAGTYREHTHGFAIRITSSSDDLGRVLLSEPDLFVGSFLFEKEP